MAFLMEFVLIAGCRFITRFLLIGLVFILLSMAVASILNIFYYIQFPENICDNGRCDSEI